MLRDEHHDLLMVSGLAEHMPCTCPENSGKHGRHESDTSNTTFGLERGRTTPAMVARPLPLSTDTHPANEVETIGMMLRFSSRLSAALQ